MNNLKINEAGLQAIIDKLDKEISNLEKAYKNIEAKMCVINGSSDTWKSESQKTTYEYYEKIQKDFSTSVENIKNHKEFLAKTLENYTNSIVSGTKNIENNGDSLNIN